MHQTRRDKLLVFLSHVEEDVAVASEIKTWLEDNLLDAVEIFVSSDGGIIAGDEWEAVIIEKLKNCRIALVLCTQMSVRQPWINFEAGGAWVHGARVIPLCYHSQRKSILPRPLSSRHALDLSEENDIQKLLEIIAEEAGLRAPDINPSDLITRLPTRNNEELDASGRLPDIRVEIGLSMVRYENGVIRDFISIEAQNHDRNSVFLTFPSIAIKNSKERLVFVNDFNRNPVPTGELRPGDSRTVIVDPATFQWDGDLEDLGEVVFRDKIGREFKGSEEDTLQVIRAWKEASQGG